MSAHTGRFHRPYVARWLGPWRLKTKKCRCERIQFERLFVDTKGSPCTAVRVVIR